MSGEEKSSKIIETGNNSESEYPFEYFDAQVHFAFQWANLSDEPLDNTLLRMTALYRRITDKKPPKDGDVDVRWKALLDKTSVLKKVEDVSKAAYAIYLMQNHSVYSDPVYPKNDDKHFGYFSFDHYPPNELTGEKDRIKIHFINRNRGDKSGLDNSFLPQRQENLRRMFSRIRNLYPEAQNVIGGSWLYALPGYRDSFPPDFTQNMKRLVPKGFEHIPNSVSNMSFEGNSVWGQFVNRKGGVRQQVYDKFIRSVTDAKNLDDLVNAFPNVPYQPKSHISVFYDWIDKQEL